MPHAALGLPARAPAATSPLQTAERGDLEPANELVLSVAACAAIHLDRIPGFSYDLLWWERSLRSVVNYTRPDASEFLELAAAIPVRTEIQTFPLADGNEALQRLSTR